MVRWLANNLGHHLEIARVSDNREVMFYQVTWGFSRERGTYFAESGSTLVQALAAACTAVLEAKEANDE